MWDPIDLYDHARDGVKLAIQDNRKYVDIILDDSFSGDLIEIQKMGEILLIKLSTERLREEFSDYTIKSAVAKKDYFKAILSFSNAKCSVFYPLMSLGTEIFDN